MRFVLFYLIIALVTVASAAEPERQTLEFAKIGERSLKLDLWKPVGAAAPLPLIVYVHGGAWRRGSRESVPIKSMTGAGFAIASVDYRLSPEAKFPAQVHDIKAAVRFLRAKAEPLGLATESIAIVGTSAGGHLAALVGVSNGHVELEGKVGGHLDQSSAIGAIVSFYGAANLNTILKQSTPHGLSVRVPALELLLGAVPEKVPDIAALASPVSHVDAADPPLLLLHGDRDPQMPINQSHELHGAFLKVGAASTFTVVHGAAHGGKGFYTPEQLAAVARFLQDEDPR